MSASLERKETDPADLVVFDDRTPRLFMLATVIWGLVGMLVGLVIPITEINVR